MAEPACLLCGGTHYGSGACPFRCGACKVNTEPCARSDCERNARYAKEVAAADAVLARRLRVNGVGRATPAEEPEMDARVLEVYFTRKPSDDEMRAFHDYIRDFRVREF